MAEEIKILDCTLRDGGYVNNWEFGAEVITAVVNKLSDAQIELIECGYLSAVKETSEGSTIYSSMERVNALLKGCGQEHDLACMINYGECPIDALPRYSGEGVDTLRVAFHKKDMEEALAYASAIQQLGYKVFVQPMITASYTPEELATLFRGINAVHPAAAYIVDSFGTMRPKELESLFAQFDAHVAKDVTIGFHSHNNLQLSFSNAQHLIALRGDRGLIIDSSVFGMGRGAGNLCTELITLHLNENEGKGYNTLPILEVIDEWVNPIFIHSPWGYSVPFYIASVNECHPNYASYLVNKQTLKVKSINLLLSQIPAAKKNRYDAKVIEQLYINYQSREIDDAAAIALLEREMRGRRVLLLAPGKTLQSCSEVVKRVAQEEGTVVIAVNFVPTSYAADYLFVSNLKRFSSLREATKGHRVIATSNIASDVNDDYIRVNYHSLIDPTSVEMDNAGVMLLHLLRRVGAGKVLMAGFDGFRTNAHENYYSDEMINSTMAEPINDRNACIAGQIDALRSAMDIEFVTPSLYEDYFTL